MCPDTAHNHNNKQTGNREVRQVLVGLCGWGSFNQTKPLVVPTQRKGNAKNPPAYLSDKRDGGVHDTSGDPVMRKSSNGP